MRCLIEIEICDANVKFSTKEINNLIIFRMNVRFQLLQMDGIPSHPR